MMSAQVCFPFKGLALQLFWESIRCPSESGHLALNRCAIASRDKTLVSSGEDMAPKATPSIYISAHTLTSVLAKILKCIFESQQPARSGSCPHFSCREADPGKDTSSHKLILKRSPSGIVYLAYWLHSKREKTVGNSERGFVQLVATGGQHQLWLFYDSLLCGRNL